MKANFYVLLSLGSNVGDRYENINKAIEKLSQDGIIYNLKTSKFYETEPVGYKEQGWFLNCSVSGYTNLDSIELFKKCKEIEKELGRKKRARWHEREIDIDILLYSDLIFHSDLLTIPHPRMHERKFVLVPSAEIAPNAIHPLLHSTIKDLLEKCQDNSKVCFY